MSQKGNFYQIILTYDLSKCRIFNSSVQVTYYCSFHAMAANIGNKTQFDYTFILERRDYAKSLKEGQISK